MLIILILTIAGAIALWVSREHLFGRAAVAAPAAARRGAPDAPPQARAPAGYEPAPRPAKTPDLVMLEWDEEICPKAAVPAAAPPSAPFRSDPLRRKLRDRYVQARFPGVAASSADLEDGQKVVNAVRLYFEEGKLDRADELLEIAIEQTPGSKVLRLAQLELAFLRREAHSFTAFARDFRIQHPLAAEWAEICRLGSVLAPTETTLFGAAKAEHSHYGPWPDLPNWLHASWDLTAEILAADLHRGMASVAGPVLLEAQRSAR